MTDAIRITVSDIQTERRREREEEERIAALKSRPRSGAVLYGEGPVYWWAIALDRLCEIIDRCEHISWWVLPVVLSGVALWGAVIVLAYKAIMGVAG